MTLIELKNVIDEIVEERANETPVDVSIASQRDRHFTTQVTEVYFDLFRNTLVIVPEE